MIRPLVSVIILSYNSKHCIEKCLDSLLAQDYQALEILIIITGSADGSKELIYQKYSRNKKIRIFDPGENLWFSRGNNFGIKNSQGTYVLALNQDTVLEPAFLERLAAVMEHERDLGSVTGKLRHYDFSINSKTKILDSTGIEMFKTKRVIDRGQWEVDQGQYDWDTEVFGASGAAAMYRRSALEEVKLPKAGGDFEYFDEDFVAYKEDVDLAWRLQLSGFKCKHVPGAVLYHGRTVGRSWPTQFVRFILNRREQSRLVRKLSFKNHYLMVVKNSVGSVFWRHFAYFFAREILLFIYTFAFEPFQVFALADFFKQLPEARRKRAIIMSRVKIPVAEIAALFH